MLYGPCPLSAPCKINPGWNVGCPLLRDDGELIFVLMTPGWAGVSLSVQCPDTGATFPAWPAPGLHSTPALSRRQVLSGITRDQLSSRRQDQDQPPEVFPDNT